MITLTNHNIAEQCIGILTWARLAKVKMSEFSLPHPDNSTAWNAIVIEKLLQVTNTLGVKTAKRAVLDFAELTRSNNPELNASGAGLVDSVLNSLIAYVNEDAESEEPVFSAKDRKSAIKFFETVISLKGGIPLILLLAGEADEDSEGITLIEYALTDMNPSNFILHLKEAQKEHKAWQRQFSKQAKVFEFVEIDDE